LGRFGEQPPQMLSVRDDDLGFGHATILTALITLLEGASA
jgi:hypothetical protein